MSVSKKSKMNLISKSKRKEFHFTSFLLSYTIHYVKKISMVSKDWDALKSVSSIMIKIRWIKSYYSTSSIVSKKTLSIK